MVAEQCVLGDTRSVATWRWQLQMKICRNWASLQSTVERRDEWNEWSFVVKSYVSLLSTHVPALLTGAENPAVSPDMSIATIRATFTEDGGDSSQETLPRLGDQRERGPALAVIRGITDMNGALAWRALITRYAPKHSAESTKSHERNPQCKDLSLRAHSIRDRTGRMAGEHSQVGIDFWRPFQRVNEESSLSWQSTDECASPTSDAKPGYLRGDDSSDSSVPATQRTVSGRCDSDTPTTGEDQMTWRSMPWRRKAKAKARERAKLMDQRRVASYADVLATWPKIAGSRTQARVAHPTARARKVKAKAKAEERNSVNEVTTPTESTPTPPGGNCTSQISRITQDDTWDRPVTMDEDEDDEFETEYILAAIRHRETPIQSKDWHVVHVLVDNCADEHVCSPRDFEWIAMEPSRNPHLGIGERTQTETLWRASSSDETSRWTQNLDHISSMWSQRTHHECGQVLCQGERSMRHVLDTWWCLVARGGWRDCGRQSSKPLRIGMLDQTWKRVGSCANWRLQWKRRRTCRISCCSSTTNRCRDLDGCTAPRELMHQELTKNTSNLRSFR